MNKKELVFVPQDIALAMEFAKLAARYRVRPGQKLREGMYIRIYINCSADNVGSGTFRVMGRPSMSGGSFNRLHFKKVFALEKRPSKYASWPHGVDVANIMHKQAFHLNPKTIALAEKLRTANIFNAWVMLNGRPHNEHVFDNFRWNAQYYRVYDESLMKGLMERTEREEAARWNKIQTV